MLINWCCSPTELSAWEGNYPQRPEFQEHPTKKGEMITRLLKWASKRSFLNWPILRVIYPMVLSATLDNVYA